MGVPKKAAMGPIPSGRVPGGRLGCSCCVPPPNARAQLKSGLMMSRESMKNRAGQQAKHLLQHKEILNLEERLAQLDAVTLDDVHQAAIRIFTTKPSLAALGPLSRLEGYDWVVCRLAA